MAAPQAVHSNHCCSEFSRHIMRANSPHAGAAGSGRLSAGFAQSEPSGCCVGHSNDAIEADGTTAFAGGLVAEAAQVLVANAAGSDGWCGVSLIAVIFDFDRLVDAAVGASDGGGRGAAPACPMSFMDRSRTC